MKVILWVMFASSIVRADTVIKLSDFLLQVRAGNQSIRASDEINQGAALRASEGSIPLAPLMSASAQHMSDEKPTSASSLMGNQTITDMYSFGVSQNTRFGLLGKVTYGVSKTNVSGVSPTLVPASKYFDSKPVVEANLSLWRNIGGTEVRAQEEMTTAAAQGISFAEGFKFKAKIAEAEVAYWRLALARQVIEVQQESFDRAVKLKNWNASRVRAGLGDRADLLQSEAALELRKLDLQMAYDEQSAASRNFNSLRGVSNDQVNEKTEIITPEIMDKISGVKKSEHSREDVMAAKEQLKVLEAAAQVGVEKAKPQLDLFGNYGWNGRDSTLGSANTDAIDNQHPTWTVGVKLLASFNFGMASNIREGYAKEKAAAQLNLERKEFDENQDWKDLNIKYEDSKRKFELAKTIERVQKEKMEYERERLKRGRTTTYQVLMFEQDYAAAELSRIRVQAEILQLQAQLKMYSNDQTGGLL